MNSDELTCPSCGVPSSIHVISYAGSPDCPNCGHTFEKGNDIEAGQIPSFAYALLAKDRKLRELAKKPILVSVIDPDEHGDARIIVRSKPSRILMHIIFIGIYVGYSIYKTGLEQTLQSFANFSLSNNQHLVLLIFAMVVLVMALWRVVITVSDTALTIARGPLFNIGKGRTIPFDDITRLDVNVRIRNNSSSSGGNSRRKTVRLLVGRESGDSVAIFQGRIELDTHWVEKTLHAMLAERDERFPRCWLEYS